MAYVLGFFPTSPMMLAFLIPIAYSLNKKRRNLRTILLIALCGLGTVVFYSLTSYLYTLPFMKLSGYSVGKFMLFVLLPAATVFYIEGWDWRKILRELGVHDKNLRKSVHYGLLAAAVTIVVTLAVMNDATFDIVNHTILFFEAFNEEFFFRGFLFLYLMKKTSRDIAFATSTSAFVLAHPQHFTELFLISTIVQGLLLTWVADKTKNIIGPWVGHGLNRCMPTLIKSLL
jgi:membrane protease YdiL (CAAX protease family)